MWILILCIRLEGCSGSRHWCWNWMILKVPSNLGHCMILLKYVLYQFFYIAACKVESISWTRPEGAFYTYTQLYGHLDLECLAWRRLKGDLINAYKYSMVGVKWMRPGSFWCSSKRTRGHWHKLEQRKFHTRTMKKFFTLKVTEYWNRLPREVVASLSLEILKTCLNAFLCNLL